MSKRVIRILSYEGNPQWVDATMRSGLVARGDTVHFDQKGTIKELHRIEMADDETLEDVIYKVLRDIRRV